MTACAIPAPDRADDEIHKAARPGGPYSQYSLFSMPEIIPSLQHIGYS
jgi:hypothetical protein